MDEGFDGGKDGVGGADRIEGLFEGLTLEGVFYFGGDGGVAVVETVICSQGLDMFVLLPSISTPRKIKIRKSYHCIVPKYDKSKTGALGFVRG